LIKAKDKDNLDAKTSLAELIVTMPRDKAKINLPILRFLERFPLLEKLLTLFRVI